MAKQNGSNGNGASRNGTDPPLTPLEEWTRLRIFGTVKVLESTGRVIRWRPVELIRALQQGKIPDHLTAYVASRVWAGPADDLRSAKEQAVDWLEYLDLMAVLGLMAPDPTTLEPGDLLYEELVEIDETVRNPAKAVLTFPGKQKPDVDTRPESSQVQQAAE